MARTPKTEEYSNCDLTNVNDAYMVMTADGELVDFYATRQEAETAITQSIEDGDWSEDGHDIYMKVTTFRAHSTYIRNP